MLDLTPEEQEQADRDVKNIREWLASDRGKQAVRRASARARASAKLRREARKLDMRRMRR